LNTNNAEAAAANALMEGNRPLTKKQVAAWLQVHPSTIEDAVKRGDLRHRKLGYFVRFMPQDITDWLENGGTAPIRRKSTGRPPKNKAGELVEAKAS
jgi:excisionase family DNA binding protein